MPTALSKVGFATFKKPIFTSLVFVLPILLFSGYATSSDSPVYGLTVLSESKYVSEGRENLIDSSLISTEGTANWRGATVGVWYATGESEAYDELNIFVEYGFEFGAFDASMGYTRLEFPEDNEHDNEMSVGISVNNLPWITPGIDYTHSTEASGGFLEISLRSELILTEDRSTIEFYILEGFDFGYASEDYDGPNHAQAGIEFSTALTDRLNLVGSLIHSWALEDVEREGLGDKTWFTIGVTSEI
jgi:hypothetical protein